MPPTPEEEAFYRNSPMHRNIGPQGDPTESEQRVERQREEDGYLPGMNREVWFSGMGDGGGIPQGRRRNRINSETPYNPPEPHNYVDGIDWKPFSENMDRDHPIELNGEHDKNISEPFIQKSTRLFNAMRKRPLPDDYHFTQEETHDQGAVDGRALNLYHRGLPVLNVRWDTRTGHTNWLGPIGAGNSSPNEHRHMTLKLLQEAWDISRRNNEYGPAASDNLSKFSGKILKKYNPNAEEYRASDYAHEYDSHNWDQETAEEYDHYPHEEGTDFDDGPTEEERYQDALSNHEHWHGRPCEECGGAGKSVMTEDTSWNHELNRRTPNGIFLERATRTERGNDSNSGEVNLTFQHPYFGTAHIGGDRPEVHGYVPVGGNWGSAPTWEKPCTECGYYPHPGFPAHEDNNEYHEQVDRAQRNM
jgi:hypothetical protein